MNNQTPIALDWTDDAEAPASSDASASCQCRLENIRVLAVIVPPRKLVQVERQIFRGHIVVSADNSALQKRPEAIQIRRVHLTANVLAARMINRFVREFAIEMLVTYILIRGDQFNFVANCLTNEVFKSSGSGVLDYLTDHVTLTADRADNAYLARTNAASPAMLTFAGVLVLFLSANERLIYLDLPHQLWKSAVLKHRSDTMADIESGLVRRRPAVLFEHPLNLQRTHALFRLANEVDNLEPDRKWIIRVLENGSNERREAIAVFLITNPDFASLFVYGLSAAFADPIPSAALNPEYLFAITARTANAFRPAQANQQFKASILSVVLLMNLSKANHNKRTLHPSRRGVK